MLDHQTLMTGTPTYRSLNNLVENIKEVEEF